jgi:hypothetical protein
MANHDSAVEVNVTLDAASVGAASFTTLLVVTDLISGLAVWDLDTTRNYASAEEVALDDDLLPELKAALNVAFAQTIQPNLIKVGKTDYGDIADSMSNILSSDSGWFGFVTTSRIFTNIQDFASWAETNKKIFIAQSSEATFTLNTYSPSGINPSDQFRDANYSYTALIWYEDDNEFADIAIASNRLSVDPDLQVTTWANMTPVLISASVLSSTELANIRSYNANTILPFYTSVTFMNGTMVNGKYIDEIVTKEWVAARIKESCANLLLNISNQGRRYPFNEQGFAPFKAAVLQVLTNGENIGHFEPGTKVVTVPKRAELTPEEISARTLNISFRTQPSGAVQGAYVSGVISVSV